MGKKKAALLDLDDEEPAAAAPAEDDSAAAAAKPAGGGKKKEKKKDKKAAGKKGGFADESDDDIDPLKTAAAVAGSDEDEPPAAAKKGGKAKPAAKKGAAAAFALLAGSEGEEEEEEEEDEPAPPPKPKGKPAKGAAAKVSFAALEEDEEDADGDDAEEEAPPALVVAEVISVDEHPKADKLKVVEVDAGAATYKVITNAAEVEEGMLVVFARIGTTTPGSKLKIEKRNLKGVDSFGMLCSAYDIGWAKEPDGKLVVMPRGSKVGAPCPDKPPKEEPKKGAAKKEEKQGKKKGDKAAALFAALGMDEDEGAAPAAAEDEDMEEAPVAAKPKGGKKKDKGAKAASLFAALEEDGEAGPGPAADEDEEMEDAAPKPKSKKKDKGSKAAALFAALEDEGGAEEGAEEGAAPAVTEKKKKKKAADIDSMLAAMALGDEPAPSAANGDGDGNGLVLEKKKGKKKGTKDMDALFAAVAEEGPSTSAPAAADPGPSTSKPAPAPDAGKGGKKGKAGPKVEEDAELAALLAELDAPKAQPEPAGGKKDKKKKKGKGGDAGGADDDIDALLAQIDGPKAAAAPAQPAAAAAPAPAAATPSPEPAAAADAAAADSDGDDGDDVGGEGGKELTAAQKKKLKKKQKEKEKKAAAKEGGEEGEEGEAAPAAKKGGKAVKESAMAKKIREEMERRRAAEEAARAEEEALRKAEEEEIRKMEEEEKRKAEEKAAKKAKEKAKKEQLKKEGKLLTGKAKAEAQRLAAVREQLLAQAAEKGLKLEHGVSGDADAAADAAAAAEAAEKKKKVVYTTKKQQQKKTKDEEDAKKKEEEEAAKRKAEEEEAARKKAEEAAAAAAAAPGGQEEEEDDDWEAMDLDQIKIGAAAKAAEEAAAAAKAAADAEAAAKAKAEAEAAAAASKSKAEAAKAEAAKAKAAQAKASAKDESEDEEEGSGSGSDDEGSESGSESGSSGSESGSDDEEGTSEDGSDSDDDGSDEESTSESESESDDDDDDSSDYSEDSEEAKERRIEEARAKRLARSAAKRESANKEELRSPICCILGHVDVGKTKILDNIRRTNVQDGEAGGITQQIGATFVPADAIDKRTASLRSGRAFDMKLPGLLVIDTPGHESFTNLRQRGSSLCDIAVLIVDLMHGLEQQTIESINLLKMRKTPFIIALNKVDRMYGWKSVPDSPIRDSFKRQKEHVEKEFDQRSSQVFLQLNEQGLNVAVYWKNPDPRRYVNVVPTSAITGEGIPDLLQLMVKLTQTMMGDRLMYVEDTHCAVLEVKTMEGLGTTVDCVLLNGMLKVDDKIVVCGLGGPLVSRIKALKTPQVLKEMRVKGQLMDHQAIRAAMGVKIVAPGLEQAVAGTSLYVVGPEDDEEELKDAVQGDMADIFSRVDRGGEGLCVQASTLGSLEALLAFLSSDAVNIPVASINIGPVHKRDVLRANAMNERKCPKYAVILAFDVPVGKEARDMAAELNVRVFTADIIYHLQDQFVAYMKEIKAKEQEAARLEAVFPCVLKILPTCIFNKKDPIVMGVEVKEGVAKVGTPLCVPTKEGITLGRIASMELNHKAVDTARAGQSVAMKIEADNADERQRLYGRHFDHTDELVSKISRESIDALKAHFQDDMTKDDWRLVIKLKKVFTIG